MTEGPIENSARAEARAWVKRMKDAHSAADRSQDLAHQRAYDEVSNAYDVSSVLRASDLGRRRDLGSAFPARPKSLGRDLAFASIAALALAGAFELSGGRDLIRPVAIESVMLSTGIEAKDVTLADGSKVSMAPASEVRIDIDRNRRLAEVRKGHVRLTIARDKRAFVIIAGETRIQTDQGIYDAQAKAGSGTVSAVERRISRAAPAASGQTGSVGNAGPTGQSTIEFKAEPLGEAIKRINLVHAGPPIELDPSLSRLLVTGVFQQGNSQSLARSLALAFNLKATISPSGAILLSR